jgi:hypothetical protein
MHRFNSKLSSESEKEWIFSEIFDISDVFDFEKFESISERNFGFDDWFDEVESGIDEDFYEEIVDFDSVFDKKRQSGFYTDPIPLKEKS